MIKLHVTPTLSTYICAPLLYVAATSCAPPPPPPSPSSEISSYDPSGEGAIEQNSRLERVEESSESPSKSFSLDLIQANSSATQNLRFPALVTRWLDFGIEVKSRAKRVPSSAIERDLRDTFPSRLSEISTRTWSAAERLKVTHLGTFNLVEEFSDVEPQPWSSIAGIGDDPNDYNSLILLSYDTQNMYLVQYPDEPSRGLLDEDEDEILVAPEVGDYECEDEDESEEESEEADYSDSHPYGVIKGSESRYRVFRKNKRPSGMLYTPLLKINGGTGALIGRRHFLTAAHVVTRVNNDGEVEARPVEVRVAKNGWRQIGRTNYATKLWVEPGWMDNPSSSLTRRSVDLAWGIMRRRAARCAGYYGYIATSVKNTEEKDYPLTNLGYPSCKKGPSPRRCEGGHIYEDASNCDILDSERRDKDGWGRAVSHNCDANAGHSGSPILVTKDDQHYVFALHGGHIGRNNYAARLTPRRFKRLQKFFQDHPRDK